MSETPRTDYQIEGDAIELVCIKHGRMIQHARTLERELNRYKHLLDWLIGESILADETQVEFSGPVYLCTAKNVEPGCELEALEKFIKEVKK